MAETGQVSWTERFGLIGPGLAVAATGVGAGDMIAAAVAGAQYGSLVLWAALAGAMLKYALNEGIARWQLATGSSLLEGWARHLPRPVLWLFGGYLVLWSFLVAGALMAACGLAAHALVPALPVGFWGVVHALAALGLVLTGGYPLFERLAKGFIAGMFVLILVSAVLLRPDPGALLSGLVLPRVPSGSGAFLLGVIGGVGGSVTLLNYGYWLRERGWTSAGDFRRALLDLRAAYALTGCFGVAIMVVAAGVAPEAITGNQMVLEVAARLEVAVGAYGGAIFLLGFWGAVFSSMLGVWQGVPYLYADLARLLRPHTPPPDRPVTASAPYRAALLFLALPPMTLLVFDRPVFVVVVYSIAGACFMPFLAATLLVLNNRPAWVGALRNRWPSTFLLTLSLVVFLYLAVREIAGRL